MVKVDTPPAEPQGILSGGTPEYLPGLAAIWQEIQRFSPQLPTDATAAELSHGCDILARQPSSNYYLYPQTQPTTAGTTASITSIEQKAIAFSLFR